MGKKRFQQRRLPEIEDDSDVTLVVNDDELLKRIHDSYNGLGYSPENRVKKILADCHEHMQELTRATVVCLLAHGKKFDLDAALTSSNIKPNDPQWVANVRHLTQNIAIGRGLVSLAEEIHSQLGSGDLATEVWGIIKEPREQLLRAMAVSEEAVAAAATQARFGTGGVVGPAVGGAQPSVPPPTYP